MRFLCLHGAIGNIDNITIQLSPLQKEFEKDHAASFYCVNAPVEVTPPEGFGEYFGVGPHYRWINDGGVAEHSMLTRVRKIPEGQNSEDVMRALAGEDRADRSWNNKPDVMDYLYDQLEKNPDIEGIVGYSEGASVAASFIMDEEKRCQDTGRARRIKCALFFTGWPPISPDNKLILADEDERMIDIPTLHVVGANDPYRHGAEALYNVCDPDTAAMFDTGKGHTIPRSGLVITELGNEVRELIERARVDE
ncbi:uncharacterized protein PFLUO_LOCUS5949 [Penicillium psychrofluorescens]|uniref:uncharacterized protein n=1 Tax=Penicillium psychrofluorescens TaxID=3158075 RepID=UPI003CCC9139